MIRKLFISLFILAVSGTSAAGSNLLPNDSFDTPNKQFHVKGIKKFGKSDTILLPMIYLHTLVQGTHKQSKGGAHAKAEFSVSNLSPDLGAELATEIHHDLVLKLRSSGWTVLTYEDVKDHAGWSKLKRARPEKVIGVDGFKNNLGFGDQYWMTSYPKGTPNLKTQSFGAKGAADLHSVHTKVAKKIGANLLFPVLRFDSPVAYGSSGRGYKKTKASASVIPAMELGYAHSGFYSVKGAWGGVDLKSSVRISESVGSITKVDESSGKDVSLFTFKTFRSIAKGDYVMTLDEAAYRNTILKVAKDYNDLLVSALKVVAPKS